MHCSFAERTNDVLDECEREEAKEGSDRAFRCMGRIDFVVHVISPVQIEVDLMRIVDVVFRSPITVDVWIDERT